MKQDKFVALGNTTSSCLFHKKWSNITLLPSFYSHCTVLASIIVLSVFMTTRLNKLYYYHYHQLRTAGFCWSNVLLPYILTDGK